MKLILNRSQFTDNSTIGNMVVGGLGIYTLEDGQREHKVYGETCIPAGTYKLELRNEGGMTKRYAKRYKFHRGMIWLREVPMFEWIYIHVGNTSADTLGCILVGLTVGADFIGRSRDAYKVIYETIADAIDSPEGCTITIVE